LRSRSCAAVKIVVLYFAALRELLGISEEELSLPAGPLDVAGLSQHLALCHPRLAAHLPSVRFAVNEAFVPLGAPVGPGDVVALIPPVSGG
jgi:sulfur-carrier protein